MPSIEPSIQATCAKHTIDVDTAVYKTNNVASRLLALRQNYGLKTGAPLLSQADFSRHIGAMPAYYAQCESGAAQPTIVLLAAIRDRTGVSLDWLISGGA